MFNTDVRVLLIDTSIAEVNVQIFDRAVGQDAGLFKLLIQCVTIVGVIREASRTKNQITFERADDPDFDTKLVRCSGFALGDHLNLGCMPAVELGYTFGLEMLGLRHQLFRLLQGIQNRLL